MGHVTAQDCKLTGRITGLGRKPVVFGYSQKGVYKLDTVYAINDRFTYLPKPSDDGQISLRISRPRYTSFWYEPGLISVSGSVDKPYKLAITGGPENNALTKFRQTIEWPLDAKKIGKYMAEDSLITQQKHIATTAFIRLNPATLTSAYLLYWEAETNQKSVDAHQHLLTALSPTVQASSYGKKAAKQIKIVQNRPVAGRMAPAFSLPDTTGKTVSLADFKGRYVLLDFWGHWCGPCIRAFPKLKTIQQKYADKLTIIGVAAEFAEDKQLWINTIKKADANWVQLSELAGDKGDVNERYNISSFPAYFLLDKKGILVEQFSDVDDVTQKLASINELN